MDRTPYMHAKQPHQAWVLTEARAQILAEVCAEASRHTEVQSKILEESCACMLKESLEWTFLLKSQALIETHDRTFLLKVWVCIEAHAWIFPQ